MKGCPRKAIVPTIPRSCTTARRDVNNEHRVTNDNTTPMLARKSKRLRLEAHKRKFEKSRSVLLHDQGISPEHISNASDASKNATLNCDNRSNSRNLEVCCISDMVGVRDFLI